MYCKKCGKFVGSDAELCAECAAKAAASSAPRTTTVAPQPVYRETPVQQPVYREQVRETKPQAQPVPQPVLQPKIGLCMPIFAMILSELGIWLAVFAAIILEIGRQSAWVWSLLNVCESLVVYMRLFGFVFATHAIRNFTSMRGKKNAIAIISLIFGINALMTTLAGLFLTRLLTF